MTRDDKERIDKLNLEEMDVIFINSGPTSWPFRDPDTGDYFCDRYERLKGEAAGHLADPN